MSLEEGHKCDKFGCNRNAKWKCEITRDTDIDTKPEVMYRCWVDQDEILNHPSESERLIIKVIFTRCKEY